MTQTELPKPEISLEKGVLTPLTEGADCTVPAQALNRDLCGIESGTVENPVELGINKKTEITFRVTNTGPEPLLDPTVGDETTIGATDPDTGEFLHNVEDIACVWPTKTVDGKTRNYLAPVSKNSEDNEDSVAICTGFLTLPKGELTHQDVAEVFAIGEVSKKLATDDAEFNAETPEFRPPLVELPMTGGQAALIFLLIAVLIAGGVIYYARKRRMTQLNE